MKKLIQFISIFSFLLAIFFIQSFGNESIAQTLNNSDTKFNLNPSTVYPIKDYGFSQGVMIQTGKTIYLSGQVAWDKNQKVVGKGDLGLQIQKALENLKLTLNEAQATPKDIVEMEMFVVDYKPQYQKTLIETVGDFLQGSSPAVTLIDVPLIAADQDLLVEIKAIAVVN
ncbi:RidA family protein [Plectonema cf. radiosum LEGE 06105]|uniref:RidA family protein n=1 Tax=Plectonema cf. radiosum LEGE 06105 TaxID=945769 RepID=A0A8J7F2H6_9CYAN|nr:RidA family protein [Plectonema radiosum]MBE9211119.1 RidA family protein [Plectonema cf. radiosum LEGE 06105]